MEYCNNIEKTYCLYASDWHLSVMLLPFISKRLNKKDRIYMKFEHSIENNIKLLTSKLKFKNKDEISDIRWNMEINDDEYTPNTKIYIVAGSEEYMKDMNKKIRKFYINKNCKVKIINCFDICKEKENLNLIGIHEYNNVLTTKGESLNNQ